VVSDGSTDRTVERARAFPESNLIVFEKNRGYGAAIKEAWRRSDADLVSFLDADGIGDDKGDAADGVKQAFDGERRRAHA